MIRSRLRQATTLSSQDCKAIPIFINARDRFVPLRRLVTWLLQAGYERIYVLDNASSYRPLLDFYACMRDRVHVVPLQANVGPTALWKANILDRLNITGPFVCTDPDVVPVEGCPADALAFFWKVLQDYPDQTKVGFGLRIDDLPDHYRLKQTVIAWELQFWERKIAPHLYDAPIDTTFALYRPGARHDVSGIRTGFPYLARHLSWYENSDSPSDDHRYYVKHAKPGLSHWGGANVPGLLDAAIRARIGKCGVSVVAGGPTLPAGPRGPLESIAAGRSTSIRRDGQRQAIFDGGAGRSRSRPDVAFQRSRRRP
jgi:hypothetical protein